MNQSDIAGSMAVTSKAWSSRYHRIKAVSFPAPTRNLPLGSSTTILNVHLHPTPRLNTQLPSYLIASPDDEAGTTLS